MTDTNSGDSCTGGNYRVECPECGELAPFYVYGFDQSGNPRWYVCSSCESHFSMDTWRSLYTDTEQ